MGYALITGASGGIGRELAALFAADGHDLAITARSQERLDMVKTKLEQRFWRACGDVRHRSERSKCAEETP